MYITAALATLDLVGPNTIEVTGTCREKVAITDRDRLTIQAPDGQTATILSPNQIAPPIVNIVRSRSIALRGLVITGGFRGVRLALGSVVEIQRSRVENHANVGVEVAGNSTIALGGTNLTMAVRVGDNGGAGVLSDSSTVWMLGFTTIEQSRAWAEAAHWPRPRGRREHHPGQWRSPAGRG